MKRIKQAVTCLSLATMLSASAPCLAETGEAPRAAEPGGTPIVQKAPKADFSRLQRMATWSNQAMGLPVAPFPLKVNMQTSGGGKSGLSTAKKTWIIVGMVVGAGVLVAGVSNHGSGNGGGGY